VLWFDRHLSDYFGPLGEGHLIWKLSSDDPLRQTLERVATDLVEREALEVIFKRRLSQQDLDELFKILGCQGRSKTRPAGRSKNRPLLTVGRVDLSGSAGGLERRPALPLGGAFRPERKAPLPIAASCGAGVKAELHSAGRLWGSLLLAFF